MSNMLGLAAALIQEILSCRSFERVPEPMVMDKIKQVCAYADSGSVEDGVMASSNLFHAAHVTQVIGGCKRVVDLGCGPATQLVRIALLNPDTEFIGVELSHNMIVRAHEYIKLSKVENVRIIQEDITTLKSFPDSSIDGIISTMTLHHLPDIKYLDLCFQQVRRVLKQNGAVYLADFGRLKSPDTMYFFSHMHENSLPVEVVQDYEYSLRAAFSVEEFQYIAKKELPQWIRVYATFLVPFMVIIKSPDRVVDLQLLRSHLRYSLNTLSPIFRRDLNNLRIFFRLSGLSDNLFR